MKLVLGAFFLFLPLWVQAEAVCAKSSLTTLRDAPSVQGKVTWRVAQHMPFLKVESKSGWYKLLDLEGASHWGRPRDFTSKTRCVVVKTNVARLRVAPNKDAAMGPIKTVDRYTPLKRLNEEEEWIQVDDGLGNKSWIHESNVWKPNKVQAITF